jgi:ATP-dependent protease Clp ATPase subunit
MLDTMYSAPETSGSATVKIDRKVVEGHLPPRIVEDKKSQPKKEAA